LLGDGSGGVFFLVSSRSICLLVTTTMGWYFLWGPFRGYIGWSCAVDLINLVWGTNK
jgi:hypothetical protein